MPDNVNNPYESPQAEIAHVNSGAGPILTENMLYYLKGASPWLRLTGIIGFISLGIILLSLISLFFGLSQALPDTEEFAPLKIFTPGLVIIYIPFLALYFFPILFIFRFGRKIQNYLYSGNSTDLEEAFKNNKSLWTFIGVIIIISLSFFALALVIGIITAVAALTGAFSG
ncbi:MAG: hypothetical protein LBH07_05535 [Treponema sp.]|jgi:hypothetical protein|nr:hypothetical protein [Treponema sp.]